MGIIRPSSLTPDISFVNSCVNSEVYSSILPAAADCTYCQAKRFYHEPAGFCCSEGEISIAFPLMPPILAYLFTSSNAECVNFRKYARSYNNNLSFDTFATKKDNELMKNKQGIYTFKVQGKIHHYLPCFTGDTNKPTGLQFYFYDPEAELEERLSSSSRFSRDVMVNLMQVLSENPYARFLRHVKDLDCVDDYKIYLVSNPGLDQRVYNEPACNDVSAIISTNEETSFIPECHIQIYSRNATPYKIGHNFGCYDPLQYPLLFPHGEVGWHCAIEKLPPNKQKRGYRCYDPLLGRNAFANGADELLCQERLGTSLQGVLDSIVGGNTSGATVGRRVILPPSFVGGPRDMKKRYMDAMCLVRNFGKPDFFLTMTCNPAWPEITVHLLPNELPQNRPDLLSRVFNKA